jgi:hypothetical protein
MKKLPFTLVLMFISFPGIALPSPAAKPELIALEEIGELVIKQDGILINNLNIVIERAFLGGIKATAQCSVENKNDADVNYSVYIVAYDAAGGLVCCFELEPVMNTHKKGSTVSLVDSGLIRLGEKISKIDIRVVVTAI